MGFNKLLDISIVFLSDFLGNYWNSYILVVAATPTL